MAIITLAEYKVFPAYNTTQADATISVLIPSVEAHFLQIRNIPFLEIWADTESGSDILENITDRDSNGYSLISESLMAGMEAEGTGITSESKVVSWDDDDQTITLDTNCDATVEQSVITMYPAGAKLICSRMIKYLFENDGENSYRLGDESQSFDEFLGIYPRNIVVGIERFVRVV